VSFDAPLQSGISVWIFFGEFTNVAETLVSRKLVFYTQANCFPLLKATTVNLFKNIICINDIFLVLNICHFICLITVLKISIFDKNIMVQTNIFSKK
jgi:hypothetical protein